MTQHELKQTYTLKAPAERTGRRLRIARETAGLTQAETARRISVDRTTLLAVEQGLRPIRIEELLQLCEVLGVSANQILRRQAVFVDMIPMFQRVHGELNAAEREAVHVLHGFVGAEIELENAVGTKRAFDYPRERSLQPGSLAAQAEEDAIDLRRCLGLGTEPICDLLSILEGQLGVRVYGHPIDDRISGIFAWDKSIGACMLFCSSHMPDRIHFNVARQLGHFLAARATPSIIFSDHRPQSRVERYAHRFASAFLMPRRELERRYAQVTGGQAHLTRHHAVLLSRQFYVSHVALIRRLEESEIIGPKACEWSKHNGDVTQQYAAQVAGSPLDLDISARFLPIPQRIELLAQEAWEQGIYSEGQLSRLLKLHRLDLRQILFEARTTDSQARRLRVYQE